MLADGLEFDSGVIPGITWRTIVVTNTNDSGAGSLRDAVAPLPDESTEYFNGSNGVLTVAASTFSGADEGPNTLAEYFNGSNGVLTVADQKEDILTRGVYSEASSYFKITAGNDNDVFFAATRDRLIGTLGGNDTISYYEMAESTTRDSSIIDTLGGNGSSGSDGADTLLASYSADNGSSDGKKLKQLRPLGKQLFSSQEESGETIPVASDITLNSEPPVFERTITVTNTNDSGSGSLRNAVADSTKVTLKNLIIANGTGDSQDGSTENGGNDLTGEDYSEASPYDTIATGNGNDGFRSTLGIINTGNDDDFLIGGNSELRPISEIITLPPEKPKPNRAFTHSIDGEISLQFSGFPGLSAIGRSQEAVSEFSGVSSVEATLLLLPSLQKVREAARRLSGFIATGSNGNDSLF